MVFEDGKPARGKWGAMRMAFIRFVPAGTDQCKKAQALRAMAQWQART